MKYEFQVRMQQRHLNAIVGALRFRQRFLAGDVYGTIGRAAMEAWRVLPDVAHGARRLWGETLLAVIAFHLCKKLPILQFGVLKIFHYCSLNECLI